MLESEDQERAKLAAEIRRAIRLSPLSKVDIADRLGLTPQAITGWEKHGRIGKVTLAKLAALLGRTVDSFLTDDATARDAEWRDVLGYAQSAGLGDGIEAQEYAETHSLKFRAQSLARKRLNPDALGVFYGKGESMFPRIRTGDAVLFDKSDTRPQDEVLFVILVPGIAGDGYSIKRCRHFGEDVYFDALNPEGDHNWRKPRRMNDPRQPIKIIGRVRWIGSWED